METELWKECLSCKDKCCKWDLAFPLFVTPEEKRKLTGVNICHPCLFYQNELCVIHKDRPFDCRLFPFEIMKINGKFNWIIWKVNCPILNKDRKEFKLFLQQHEKEIIPIFKKYVDEYSKFRLEEFLSKYQYEILREVNFVEG